jgi:hypothetical protein
VKLISTFVCCAIVVVPVPSVAQTANNPCSTLHWNEKLLEMYPTAPLTCQAVVTKGDVKYAKFVGHVIRVNADSVAVVVHDAARTAAGSAVWRTTPDQLVSIGSKEAMAKNLRMGDELTFWVAEGEYTMVPKPGAKSNDAQQN